MLCARCLDGELRDAVTTLAFELPRSGVTATANVRAQRCSVCDHVFVDGPVLARCRLAVGCGLADAGVETGEALRHMRHALGLRSAELARLLDVRPETMSHWETGRAAPSRIAFVTVAAMVQEAFDGRTETHDRLARLARGDPHPRALAIDLR